MLPTRATLLLTIGLLALAACAERVDERAIGDEPVATARAAITGGWDATWAPSVAALVDDDLNVRCSATLIAPRALLTAAHCAASGVTKVFFGLRPGAPGAFSVPIAHVVVHPRYERIGLENDIAVVVLGASAPPSIWPAKLEAEPLGPGLVGDRIAFMGYGVDGRGGPVGRRGGLGRVIELSAQTIKTMPDPSQPCAGDSGGPALVDSDTETIVIGVISSGDVTCATYANATRLDVHLASFVVPTLARVAEGLAKNCTADVECPATMTCAAARCRPRASSTPEGSGPPPLTDAPDLAPVADAAEPPSDGDASAGCSMVRARSPHGIGRGAGSLGALALVLALAARSGARRRART
ncbi:MAG: trypsin-like serine protease [Deltaproteobacteria bacterium]|nr:trypsin-like serine protease [Deltaproteobacteria bacterium]